MPLNTASKWQALAQLRNKYPGWVRPSRRRRYFEALVGEQLAERRELPDGRPEYRYLNHMTTGEDR